MVPTRLYASLFAALLITMAAGACGGVGTAGRAPAPDTDVITQEELREELAGDLYTVVGRLRPLWMRARGEQTFVNSIGVSLVVDGVRWGSNLYRMQDIRVSDVFEVRHLSASDATIQYGPDMAGGAILVFLHNGR